jgi:hypothetical protein
MDTVTNLTEMVVPAVTAQRFTAVAAAGITIGVAFMAIPAPTLMVVSCGPNITIACPEAVGGSPKGAASQTAVLPLHVAPVPVSKVIVDAEFVPAGNPAAYHKNVLSVVEPTINSVVVAEVTAAVTTGGSSGIGA